MLFLTENPPPLSADYPIALPSAGIACNQHHWGIYTVSSICYKKIMWHKKNNYLHKHVIFYTMRFSLERHSKGGIIANSGVKHTSEEYFTV